MDAPATQLWALTLVEMGIIPRQSREEPVEGVVEGEEGVWVGGGNESQLMY